MKKRSYPAANIGSASLLMTFIVLCLVVFATLALSSALSEYQYSQKIAEYNSDYYEASNTAMQTLKEMDRLLHDAYTASPENYDMMIEEKLKSLEEITTDFTGDEPTVSYQVPVNDIQTLNVTLTINMPPQTDGGYLRITTWQKIPATEWNGDDSLDLMKDPSAS